MCSGVFWVHIYVCVTYRHDMYVCVMYRNDVYICVMYRHDMYVSVMYGHDVYVCVMYRQDFMHMVCTCIFTSMKDKTQDICMD